MWYMLNPENWKWLNDIKDFLYYRKHGCFPIDWYDYASANAMRTVISLKKMKDYGISNPVIKEKSNDEFAWKNILSDIIFAWEEILITLCDKSEIEKILDSDRIKCIESFDCNDRYYNRDTKQMESLSTIRTLNKTYVLRTEYYKNESFYENNKYFQVQNEKDYKRMLRGLALYKKYYMMLWD